MRGNIATKYCKVKNSKCIVIDSADLDLNSKPVEGELRNNLVPLESPKYLELAAQGISESRGKHRVLEDRVNVCLRNRSSDHSLPLCDQIYHHQPIQILQVCSLEIENKAAGLGDIRHGWRQEYCTEPRDINRMFTYWMLKRLPTPPQFLSLMGSRMTGASVTGEWGFCSPLHSLSRLLMSWTKKWARHRSTAAKE